MTPLFTGKLLATNNWKSLLLIVTGLFLVLSSLSSCQSPQARDTTPPLVYFLAPSQNLARLSSAYPLRVRAYDENTVADVIFFLNSDTLGKGSYHSQNDYWEFSFNTTAYADGDTLSFLWAMARDLGGNQGTTDSITIIVDNRGVPPLPVELINVAPPSTQAGFDKYRLEITWEASVDWNFNHYALYRSPDSAVADTSTLVAEIYDRTQTSWIDSFTVNHPVSYYYGLYVWDDSLRSPLSNVIKGATSAVTDTVHLQIGRQEKHRIELLWNKSDDFYFQDYRLYRDTLPEVDTSRGPIFQTQDRYSVTYWDQDLPQHTRFYYLLLIRDTHGVTYATETVSAETDSLQPVVFYPVLQTTKYTVSLAWQYSDDPDLLGYRLERQVGNFYLPCDTVAVLAPQDTFFTDQGLDENETYAYRIVTFDSVEEAASDPISVTTLGITPVTLLQLTPGRYTMQLEWTTYQAIENDFVTYEILRAAPGQSLTTVGTVYNQQQTSYLDTSDLEYNILYTYAVAVTDTNGGRALSGTLTQTVQEISRANITSVSVNNAGQLVVQWDWVASPEKLFDHYTLYRYSNLFIIQGADTIWLNQTLPNPLPGTPRYLDSTVVLDIFSIETKEYVDLNTYHANGIVGYKVAVWDTHGNYEIGNMSGNYEGQGIHPATVYLNPATNITAHSADFSWAATQPGNTYLLYSSLDTTTLTLDEATLRAVVHGQTSTTVDSLGSGVLYYFAIWARDPYGNYSDRSNVIEVQTLY